MQTDQDKENAYLKVLEQSNFSESTALTTVDQVDHSINRIIKQKTIVFDDAANTVWDLALDNSVRYGPSKSCCWQDFENESTFTNVIIILRNQMIRF